MSIIEVKKEIHWQYSFAENPSAYLKIIRNIVKAAKNNPTLEGHHLYDISMHREDNRLLLTLFFIPNKRQSKTA